MLLSGCGLVERVETSGPGAARDTATESPAPDAGGSGPATVPTPAASDEAPESRESPRPSASPESTQESQETQQATESPRPPVSVTIAASGDILPHVPVLNSANRNAGGGAGEFDFAPMFADVEPLLSSADVALCHLETPLSEDNTELSERRTFIFNSPHQLADGLRAAGYDGCDFASNHTWDHGLAGVTSTHAVMDRAGLTVAGPAPTEESADDIVLLAAGDASVAHLAYTYTIRNNSDPNTTVPTEAPWLRHALWPAVGADGIAADAERAREGGADFVVVSMHWGQEYVLEPTADQRAVAQDLLQSDAVDLILGTHVHLVQPCETINGRHVLYGLGNSLSNQGPAGTNLPAGTQDGVVVEAELTRDADGTISSTLTYQPTWIDLQDHRIRIATAQTHPESHARTVTAMESLGEGACDAQVRE